MQMKDAIELASSIKTSERLTPDEVKNIFSLLRESNLRLIGRTQLITSVLLLLEKDENLHRRFTEIFCPNNPQEEQEDEDTETRNGKVNDDTENRKEDDGDADLVEIRVENPKGDYFTNKANKKGFLVKEKSRRSKRLEPMTPSYKLIGEEEHSSSNESDDSDSETVLNNKCVSVGKIRRGRWRRKKLSVYEEAMAKCEDEMFEIDRWIGTLSSVMKRAEEVMGGKIGLEYIGTMFYSCIKQMYGQDMADIVRQDYRNALRVIVPRLKQKLDEATLVRKRWQPLWKQVFEENTRKQRDSTAKGRKKK